MARKQLSSYPQDNPLAKSYADMSDRELGLVRMYTQSYYEYFNNYLRSKRPPEGSDDEARLFLERGTEDLSKALAKLPNSTNEFFYRGMALDPYDDSDLVDRFLDLSPGDVIRDSGFSSFTSDQEVTEDFMVYDGGSAHNIMLVARSNNLKNVAPVSKNPSESEHLALPGSEFKVLSNSLKSYGDFGRVRMIEIEDVGKD